MLQRTWRVISHLHGAVLQRFWRIQAALLLRASGVTRTGRVHCYGMPILRRMPGSVIELGDNVVLCSDPRFTDMGVSRPVILKTLGAQARIRIGKDAGLSGSVICAATTIDIGDGCLFGADVQVCDTDFHTLFALNRRHESRPDRIGSAPIVIGANVFLGAGVRVLQGVCIGANTVVGAGSVVTRDLPANVIAAGVPARVIRPLPVDPLCGDVHQPVRDVAEPSTCQH